MGATLEPILKTLFMVLTIATAPEPTVIVTEVEAAMCEQDHRDFYGALALNKSEPGTWTVRNEAGDVFEIVGLHCFEELGERIAAGS